MNYIKFHQLKASPRSNMPFEVSMLENQEDRTLLLGNDTPTVLLHVWLFDGLIRRARMNLSSGVFYNDFSGVSLSYRLLLPETLAFPESTDYKFACLLREHRFEPVYREINILDGEHRLDQFGPYSAPTTKVAAEALPGVIEIYQ